MKVTANFPFNVDTGKTTSTRATKQPSVAEAGSLIWHIKGERDPWVAVAPKVGTHRPESDWLAPLVLLHICLKRGLH